jgi:HSP20 family protein
MQQAYDLSPSIRGLTRGFPAMNVGGTAKSVEIYAFAPGVDPASLDVQIERGVLTISGERKRDEVPENSTMHIDERQVGRFRRVVTLPDDIDANAVEANYRDGVLHIGIARKEAAQPRRISVS